MNFNFYGICVTVSGDPEFESLLLWLRSDFSHFLSEPTPAVASDIAIHWSSQPGVRPPLPFVFKTPLVKVYGLGARRWVEYGEGVSVFAEDHQGFKRVEVRGAISPLLYEAIYDFILSSVGEKLDLLGYHRIHALGIEWKDQAALLVLPSGSGKSALGLLLRNETGIRIYSDEMPLLREGIVYPFPIRIALRENVAEAIGVGSKRRFQRKLHGEKLLFEIPSDRVAKPKKVQYLIFKGKSEHGVPQAFRKASTLQALSGPLVLGLGLAQMREHMLRLGLAPRLAQIAVSRAKEAWLLSSQAEAYQFPWQTFAQRNCETLQSFIEEHSNSQAGI